MRSHTIWPLWPGCAFLVAVLLTSPRKIWPALLIAGLLAFALYDIGEGLTISGVILYSVADAVEVLVAALGVSYVLGAMPRLNSVKSLLTYSIFAVVLAPISTASLSASTLAGRYRTVWRVAFLTEALALLTLTPAILSWLQIATGIRGTKPRVRYLEAASMIAGLLALAYYAFVAPGSEHRPEWLYSLVPFLLWAALRFGTVGTSNSLIVVAFLAILGTVHGHGPFAGGTPVENVVSLQAFLLFAASSFMVLAAVVEEHKAAETVLRETNRTLERQGQFLQAREELLRIFVKNVPAGVAMLDRDMRYVQVSDRWCADYRLDAAQLIGRSHYEVFPDIPDRWKEMHQRALNGETLRCDEDRWERNGGTVWSRWELRPWTNLDGTRGGLIIFSEDITRRKEMEEALSGMSRKMIEAQEQERTRIARELHDDINQRLALLSVELEAHRKNPPNSAEDMTLVLTGIWKGINDLSYDVQSLSHQLHSSKLEYLGLVAAAKSFCQEFSATQQVEVEFDHDNVPRSVPYEVSLSLFRVLQEALHNALKHSNVRHFVVRLSCSQGQLNLTVSDRGVGFDMDTARTRGGLGLISMRERVRLANGTISIDSKPMAGTSIHVHVPLELEHVSEEAG